MSLPEKNRQILKEGVQAFFISLVFFLDLYIFLNRNEIQIGEEKFLDIIALGILHLFAGIEIARLLNAPNFLDMFNDWE